MYSTRFIVVPIRPSRFPLDMLRHDRCFPDTSEDVNTIADALEQPWEPGKRTVVLRVRHQVKDAPGITEARWQSFGWSVLPISRNDISKL